MAWWAGQPTYGSNPVSKFVRENFAYLKTYVDYIVNSGVTTADLAAVHAIPPVLGAVVDITVNTTIGNTEVGIGGGYNISAGIVLTVNGSFDAPRTQIFFGTGTVAFARLATVYPEWWGAIPDGATACGPAINAAIQSVLSSVTLGVGTVWFSPGRYMVGGADVIVASVDDRGAMLQGSGRYTTEINVQGGAARDGITFSHATAYGRGGGIKDMTIWAPAYTSIRDSVYLNNWGEWVMENVMLRRCGRYNLQIIQGISLEVRNCQLNDATTSGLSINDGLLTLTTTVTITGTYISLAQQVGADVQGLGITFLGCVFESNGIGSAAEGVRVRSGTATFDGCYWEDNEGHDLVSGYTNPQPSWGTSVTVINPLLQGAGGHKLAGYGGFYVSRGQFNLVGPGTWLAPAATVIVDYALDPEVNLISLPSGLTPVPEYDTGLHIGEAVYGVTIPIRAGSSDYFTITVTDGNAFTISSPTRPKLNQNITIRIRNTSGGAVGVITWGAAFLLDTWTSPATAHSRSIDFRYDGTNWVEVARSATDIPN